MSDTQFDVQPPWRGDLMFRVECRVEPGRPSTTRHRVTIHQDWSVTTPHDLAAERVAAAFGGYTSCLELVDTTIPALRPMVPLLARTVRPELRWDRRGDIRLALRDLVAGCCSGRAFPTVRSACKHLRSAEHVCAALDIASTWQVTAVLRAVDAACAPGPDDSAGVAAAVLEPNASKLLWEAGIHPDIVSELAEPARVVSVPLPLSYFLGVAYNDVDRRWLAAVLAHRPTVDVAAWLAWTQKELQTEPDEWGQWLDHGLKRDDVVVAVRERIPARAVVQVAQATGWTRHHAAAMVIDWAKAECRPGTHEFTALGRRGFGYDAPPRRALDALQEIVSRRPLLASTAPSRTDLGLLLVVLGTHAAVISALDDGIRTLADLDLHDTSRRRIR